MTTDTKQKSQKAVKLTRDDHGLIVDALGAHIENQKKIPAGTAYTDQQIAQLGRLIALKNKCATIRDAEPKKYTPKAK